MTKCSHCGEEFELKDGAIPTHDFPKPCRSVCPGSGIAPGQRVTMFGRYGVFAPYESHDGDVGWTVKHHESASEEEYLGELIAEFAQRWHAEFFAECLCEHDDDMRREKAMDHEEG